MKVYGVFCSFFDGDNYSTSKDLIALYHCSIDAINELRARYMYSAMRDRRTELDEELNGDFYERPSFINHDLSRPFNNEHNVMEARTYGVYSEYEFTYTVEVLEVQ